MSYEHLATSSMYTPSADLDSTNGLALLTRWEPRRQAHQTPYVTPTRLRRAFTMPQLTSSDKRLHMWWLRTCSPHSTRSSTYSSAAAILCNARTDHTRRSSASDVLGPHASMFIDCTMIVHSYTHTTRTYRNRAVGDSAEPWQPRQWPTSRPALE
jgi:hypothetical protein